MIVDAAAEEDLKNMCKWALIWLFIQGQKQSKDQVPEWSWGKTYVSWVRMQSKGIGRSMKIGKENILGFVQAVEDYLNKGSESGPAMKERLQPFIEQLNQINHLEAKIVQDSAGRAIYRASVKVSGNQSAKQVIKALKEKILPSIQENTRQTTASSNSISVLSVNRRWQKSSIV